MPISTTAALTIRSTVRHDNQAQREAGKPQTVTTTVTTADTSTVLAGGTSSTRQPYWRAGRQSEKAEREDRTGRRGIRLTLPAIPHVRHSVRWYQIRTRKPARSAILNTRGKQPPEGKDAIMETMWDQRGTEILTRAYKEILQTAQATGIQMMPDNCQWAEMFEAWAEKQKMPPTDWEDITRLIVGQNGRAVWEYGLILLIGEWLAIQQRLDQTDE